MPTHLVLVGPARPIRTTPPVAAAIGLAAAIAFMLSWAAPVAAHDSLRATTPADGDRLRTAPTKVELRFTGEVIPASATIVVRGPAGRLPSRAAQIDGQKVSRRLPAGLGNGRYVVAWRVTSSDGHPIQGTYDFRLQQAAAPTAPSSAVTPPTPDAVTTTPARPTTSAGTESTSNGETRDPAFVDTDRNLLPGGILVIALVVAVGAVAYVVAARVRRRSRGRTGEGD